MAGKKKLDPRQIKFLAYYLDPQSDTYANALQSGLKAGFAQEYAENITHLSANWLSEAIGRRKRMLNKAEIRLEELLDSKNENIKLSTSQFLAKTLGKKDYSEKSPLEGEDGKNLLVPLAESLKNLSSKK